MKRTTLWLLVALPFAAAPLAADSASLKRHATVSGDVVRVSDLFDAAGAAGKAVVGRSPAPGQREVFELARLREIAVRHGVDWAPASRHDRTVVERAGQPIGQVEIEAGLARAMKRQGVADDVSVSLFGRAVDVQAAQSSAEPYWFEDIRYDPRSGRVVAAMMVDAGKNRTRRIDVAGRAYRIARVPVLARPVGRNEIVRKGDVAWRTVPQSRVRGDFLTDTGDLVGLQARRSLRPGVPLRRADLRAPVLVERGSLVTLVLATGRMTLTSKGKAAEDGTLGQTVQVVNVRSKRTIEAVVDGPGRVRVPMTNMHSSNAGGAS